VRPLVVPQQRLLLYRPTSSSIRPSSRRRRGVRRSKVSVHHRGLSKPRARS